jgi:hypothetical protein
MGTPGPTQSYHELEPEQQTVICDIKANLPKEYAQNKVFSDTDIQIDQLKKLFLRIKRDDPALYKSMDMKSLYTRANDARLFTLKGTIAVTAAPKVTTISAAGKVKRTHPSRGMQILLKLARATVAKQKA